ncbi:hypothetical protein ACFL5V_02780 [Fibrobacterota bacterium]
MRKVCVSLPYEKRVKKNTAGQDMNNQKEMPVQRQYEHKQIVETDSQEKNEKAKR